MTVYEMAEHARGGDAVSPTTLGSRDKCAE